MPKERYRRVRITTTDDNVVLSHLARMEKHINERLGSMEQEIRDLRSLIESSQNHQQPSNGPSDIPPESNTSIVNVVRKRPIVVPADPISADEPLAVENDGIEGDLESNFQRVEEDKREKSTSKTRDSILDESLRTVTDIVREWSQGLAPGMQPLKELAEELNQNWSFTTIVQRELFYERETIYAEVVNIAQERHISEEAAAAALEAHRAQEGFSLKTLARLIKSHQRRRERGQIDQTPYI
ncbi:hypothetical protein BX666DRAFT_446215 [Dichotomocladium elegans]|nr:hypothetical protein BX666DRAFT_446215 [Dichotomocladium elegans]